jgi:tRNA-2-methylthio-N6-dimethylallyladenosine synthase
MFSFKYSQRPGTLAAKRMPDDVPEGEKGRRLLELQSLQKEIQTALHQGAVGTEVEVLVDSCSRRRESDLSGRTSGNTVVNFPGEARWIGSTVRVAIFRAGPNSLSGRVISQTS